MSGFGNLLIPVQSGCNPGLLLAKSDFSVPLIVCNRSWRILFKGDGSG